MKRGVYYKVSLIYMNGEEATSAVFVTRSDAYSAFNALVDALKEVTKVDVAEVKIEEVCSIVEDSVAERYWELEQPPGDIKSVLLEDFFVDSCKAIDKGEPMPWGNTTPDSALCVSFESRWYGQPARRVCTCDTPCIMRFGDQSTARSMQDRLQKAFSGAVKCSFAGLWSCRISGESISTTNYHIEEDAKKMQWKEDRGTLRAFKI